MANDIADIGINVDTSSVVKATTDLKELARQSLEVYKANKEVASGADRLNTYFNSIDAQLTKVNGNMRRTTALFQQSGKGLRNFEVQVQQAGYQVGDFAVQVMSGTNPLVAFGQQASQLAGFFGGPWGAAIGAGIAIISALGGAFWRASEDSKASLENFKETISSLQSEIDSLHLDNIKLGFSVDDNALAKVKEQMLLIEKSILDEQIRIQTQFTENMAALGSGAQATQGGKSQALIDLENQRKELQNKLNLLDAEKEAQRMLNGGLSVASGLQKAAVLNKQQELRATKEHDAYLAKMYEYYGKSRVEGEKLAKLNIASGIKAAADQASALAASLGVSLATARGIMALGNGKATHGGEIYDPRSPNYVKGAATFAEFANNRTYYEPPKETKAKKTKGGGGGGMSEDTIENKLKQVYDYLELDKYLIEQENISYSQREDTLKAALDKKLITLEEFQTAEKDLTIKHQAELAQIEQANYLRKLQDTSNLFGSLADIASAGGKKSAKAVATFQAIEGTINAYGAAIKALNTPGISLAGRFAAYASVLAAGLKGVSAIRSAGGVGGSSGGAGSVGTSPASAAASASPTTVMIQGMNPTDIFTGEQLSTLFDSLYKENNNRGMVFMVQR